MISQRLSDMLVRQIASELAAHQNYMAISLYFKRRSLDRWSELFHKQAMEEAGHALKIMNFLEDVQVEYDLPGVPGSSTKFAAAIDAIQAAAASEAKVTNEFKAMATAAQEENDWVVFQFLQWFLEEQVEEESKMAKLIDLVNSGINLFQSEALLESFDSE